VLDAGGDEGVAGGGGFEDGLAGAPLLGDRVVEVHAAGDLDDAVGSGSAGSARARHGPTPVVGADIVGGPIEWGSAWQRGGRARGRGCGRGDDEGGHCNTTEQVSERVHSLVPESDSGTVWHRHESCQGAGRADAGGETTGMTGERTLRTDSA